MFATLPLLLAASLSVTQPGAPDQRSAYPKLFRCQSAIQRPVADPTWSAACLDFRDDELARIMALPINERIVRLKTLRDRIGLAKGEGLDITPSGDIGPARVEMSARDD